MSERPKLVLLDLGGVIFPFSRRPTFEIWAAASGASADQLERKFADFPQHDYFERGEMSETRFRESVCTTLEIEITSEDFDRGWNAIYQPAHAGMADLLARLREHARLAALTNTNAIHQREYLVRYAPELGHFEQVFASHELGLRKPEPECFGAVLEQLGIAPRHAVFVDDHPENVDAARSVGLDAFLSASTAELADGLARRGFADVLHREASARPGS